MDTIYTVDCTPLVPNPYHLVHLAAARSRALGRGAEPRVEPRGEPVALLALREIAEGAFTHDELPILLESSRGEALEFSANEDPSEDELRDGMANSGSIALASQQREALLTARSIMMLKNTRRTPQDIVLNGISALAGLSLLLAPPLLGFTDTPIAAWNSWVIGAAILAVAGAALVALKEWEEWASLVLGAWTLVSPWILGFSAVQGAAVLHVLIGLTVIAVAAVELWSERNRPMTTA